MLFFMPFPSRAEHESHVIIVWPESLAKKSLHHLMGALKPNLMQELTNLLHRDTSIRCMRDAKGLHRHTYVDH